MGAWLCGFNPSRWFGRGLRRFLRNQLQRRARHAPTSVHSSKRARARPKSYQNLQALAAKRFARSARTALPCAFSGSTRFASLRARLSAQDPSDEKLRHDGRVTVWTQPVALVCPRLAQISKESVAKASAACVYECTQQRTRSSSAQKLPEPAGFGREADCTERSASAAMRVYRRRTLCVAACAPECTRTQR